MTVWLPPGRGKGAFANCTEMQWNVPWDPQHSTFFQQIKFFEFLSFNGSEEIFAAHFCPLHCLSLVHGFPHEACPFAYWLKCSVFIVALLGGVLEWPLMCLHRWRIFEMCWEVKGVCTWVFCAAVCAVWVCGHFCTSLLLSVWTSGAGWASLLQAALSQVLGHAFPKDSRHYRWATSSLWAELFRWLQYQFGKQRSLLTLFDAPQIFCALTVPTSCDSTWTLPQLSDTDVPESCPAAVQRWVVLSQLWE